MAMLTIKTKEEAERFYRAYTKRTRITGSHDTGRGIVHYDGYVARFGWDDRAGTVYWEVDINDNPKPTELQF